MAETAVTSAPATARNSKNSTPTGRSSGTGSNSSTGTPTSKRKKGGGGHSDGGSGGLAGLFASLCGGSKAKRAFEEPATAAASTTTKPATTVRRPSSSKALPAAPITTRQVSPEVEVTTTKRLSTGELVAMKKMDVVNSSKGELGQETRTAGNNMVSANDEITNGDAASSGQQHLSANHSPEGQLATNGISSSGHLGNGSSSNSLAPVVLGGTALGAGVAALASAHSTSNLLPVTTETVNENGVAGTHEQSVESVTQKMDELVVPNDIHASTGHPLPLDETEGMTSAAVQPPGSGPTFVPTSGPHAHHHHLTPHVSPSHTPVSHSPSRPHSQAADRAPNSDVLDNAILSETAPSEGGIGLGIRAESHDHSTTDEAHVVAVPVGDEEADDQQEDTNMYADGLDADDEFMDEEDRLIRQGGIGIPLGPDGKPAPLLPPIAVEHHGRKCLVLDLDETLLHSSFKTIPSADFIVPVEIESQTHNVYVIKRPGVDMFLKAMGEIYEVVVFTASLSKYADPVLDMLDIHKVVKHRLFRESCYNHKGNYVKDLSQLGREIHTSIIIDNSPASYIFHPNNAVPVSTWFNDPHDTELTDLCPFLTDLATVDDVRGVLDGQL